MKSYMEQVIIQWVPGHKNIPGNDLADVAAKEAAEMEDEEFAPIWFHSVRCRIKSERKSFGTTHGRTTLVY